MVRLSIRRNASPWHDELSRVPAASFGFDSPGTFKRREHIKTNPPGHGVGKPGWRRQPNHLCKVTGMKTADGMVNATCTKLVAVKTIIGGLLALIRFLPLHISMTMSMCCDFLIITLVTCFQSYFRAKPRHWRTWTVAWESAITWGRYKLLIQKYKAVCYRAGSNRLVVT